MELLLFWLLLAAGIGYWASQRGRSGVGWFLLSLLLSPLIGAIGLAIVGDAGRPCPVCGNRVPVGVTQCESCAYDFAAASGHTIPEVPPVSAVGGVCGNCSAFVTNADTCWKCGAPLSAPAAPQT